MSLEDGVEYDCISMQGLPALNRIQSNKPFYSSIRRPCTVSTGMVIESGERYVHPKDIVNQHNNRGARGDNKDSCSNNINELYEIVVEERK